MAAEWVKMKGKGKVASFVVYNKVYDKAWANDLPYVVASIQLDEGPKILSNIIEISPEDIQLDMPVEVKFEDVTEEYTLYKFKPVSK